ncbi:hypothetical protein RND81_07G031600 [Saponaria officinalis]|uniref:Ubiquitin-like protease family profile domain-containing protein n=1 Tax=Saponaria officinalis TaxID=3572 RepID=A0AAW1JN96_SAPOF
MVFTQAALVQKRLMEDHPGRVRGLSGVNNSVKQPFGDSASTKCGTSKKGISSEEREAIKNELREELRNEMMSFLRKMGLKLHDDREISPEHPLINQPQPSLPSLVKLIVTNTSKKKNCDMWDDTPCRLLLPDPHSGMLYEVARGKTFPMEDGHPNSIVPNHVRVKVCVVLEEFNTLQLPILIPVYDVYTLSDQLKVLYSGQLHILSATPRKRPNKDFTVESLSLPCKWLNSLVGEEGKTKVHKNDLKQFLESSELSVLIIQIFMRTHRDDLLKAEIGPRIGWLCPEATLDTKLIKNATDEIAHVIEAFMKSDRNKDEFIMAPIYNSNHWMLLVICPQTYTIYEFDPITRKEGREFALKRYKLSGGHLKVTRREPLWKSVKCPQQTKSVEYGFFVLRFMFDKVKSCTTSNDLEKV